VSLESSARDTLDRSLSWNLQQDLTLECRPVRILEFSERVLRKRSIKYVKVLWTNQSEREATWELEDLMRQKFPELFVVGKCC
jgi:hypothetical protein